MKKLIITSSALLLALSLTGCNTMNSASQYGNATVGKGIKYGATTVGSGVGYVSRGVGTVVGTGFGLATGQSAVYHKQNVVYHNGHRYVVKNGRYVRVR